ncbi:hypothetical protein C2845_PM01G41910 [Panicum miliaceum]|uniref:Uncharacterized protein n=1 Tax=Panicum miliaceum TaxID=4540 RepID=A0A3L6TLK3_PANMI|nr:hypothetical protein C2845_PM01G41910 [Panicum miliaceum]
MQDLEYSMRSKGELNPLEEARLRAYSGVATRGFTASTVIYSFIGWFVTGKHKIPVVGIPVPPLPGLVRFGAVSGGAFLAGKLVYYIALRLCAQIILEGYDPEDRMKMELANIILTKHSDDKPLDEAVRKQFFAEHLFNDMHQDSPLFRWHPRSWYVDSAFVERLKETEAELNCSDDVTGSFSRQTIANIRFGDLMDDPLACVLGSPIRDMESHNPSENKRAVLKRRGPRNRKRSHHHRFPTEC